MFKKEEKIRKLFSLVVILALLALIGYEILPALLVREKTRLTNNIEQIINNQPITNNSLLLINEENKVEEEKIELKKEVNLRVPFVSQAPFALWDNLHNNACEEAALILVHYFLKEEGLTKEIMEKEIQDLVAWQIKNLGEHKDLTLEEVGKMARDYYGWQKIRIQDKITIEDIKKELTKGNPVIVPAAGRLLGNPYYRQPGPYYHMLVIRGYQGNKFITNDPGTRRGEGYSYHEDVLYQAIHDWPGEGKDILEGEKKMLVIEK